MSAAVDGKAAVGLEVEPKMLWAVPMALPSPSSDHSLHFLTAANKAHPQGTACCEVMMDSFLGAEAPLCPAFGVISAPASSFPLFTFLQAVPSLGTVLHPLVTVIKFSVH